MSQCVPCRSAWLRLLGRPFSLGGAEGTGGSGGMSQPSMHGDDLPAALEEFRARCMRAADDVNASPGLQPLLHCMWDLVEALLLGIQDHLPDLKKEVEVSSRQPWWRATADEQMQEQDALVSLTVRFAEGPVVGEFATRSRIAISARVDRVLRLAMLAPPATDRALREELLPLRLQVDGLNFPALPETLQIRRQLHAEFGDNLGMAAALQWWRSHKDTEFPANTSKFHRVVESMLEMRAVKALGMQVNASGFWGYLHDAGMQVEAFAFTLDRRVRGGVGLTVEQRPPRSAEEAADREKVFETLAVMFKNRKAGERLCASATNVGAMVGAKRAGQPGASPQVITKLLSAARWWGCGTDSWHRFDDTWECTDKKDSLGRIVESQGRVIWRLQGGPPPALGPARRRGGAAAMAAAAGRASGRGDALLRKPRGAKKQMAAVEVWDWRFVVLLCLCAAVVLRLYVQFVGPVSRLGIS